MISLLLLFLSYATSYQFPYGRCYDSKCTSTPYRLQWISETITNNTGKYCLQLTKQECTNTKYNCCNLLNNNFNKFELHVKTECKNALNYVTINNIKKGGGVYFDIYTSKQSELRITNLKNITTDTIMCIILKEPCVSLSDFLFSNNTAIWEVKKHECCPQCILDKLYSTPPYPRHPAFPSLPPPLSTCGNKLCEPDLGEHCFNCPVDCRGTKKFCCGLDQPLCENYKCFRKNFVCVRSHLNNSSHV